MTTAAETTTTDPVAAPKVLRVESIPLSLLRPHPENPRTPKDDVSALAANIAAVGLLTPLIVREFGNADGYEVLAGHRRVEALKSLKRTEAACQVVEADDALALRIVLAENSDRREPDLLLEAQTVKALLAREGWDNRRVADHLGKTPRWVAQRLAIASLDPKVAKEVRKGRLAEWGPAAVTMLAETLRGEAQLEFVREHAASIADTDDLKRMLGAMTFRLSCAAWDLDDADLVPKAGPCRACPKQTAAQRDLFGLDTEKVLKPSETSCLDAACWRSKMTATMRAKVKAETKDGAPLLYVEGAHDAASWSVWSGFDPFGLRERKEGETIRTDRVGQVIRHGFWEECDAKARGASRALIVSGKGMGDVLWARTAQDARKPEKPAKQPKGEKKPPTLAERREKYERRVQARALELLRVRLGDDNGDVMPTPTSEQVLCLLPIYGARIHGLGPNAVERTAAVEDARQKERSNAIVGTGEAWRALSGEVVRALEPFKAFDVPDLWTEGQALAKWLGIDVEPLLAQARTDVPMPKALAAAEAETEGKPKGSTTKARKAKKR